MLGELIDLISGIAMHEEGHKTRDILGHVYEFRSHTGARNHLAGVSKSQKTRRGKLYTYHEQNGTLGLYYVIFSEATPLFIKYGFLNTLGGVFSVPFYHRVLLRYARWRAA